MHTFYYLSTCDTCKRILKELNLPETVQKVDLKKTPLTLAQVESLRERSGSYEALFSKRAQLYKQRNLKDHKLNEIDYKNLLLEHYTFLKRPVLVSDSDIFIGNTAKTIAAAKAFLDEQ